MLKFAILAIGIVGVFIASCAAEEPESMPTATPDIPSYGAAEVLSIVQDNMKSTQISVSRTCWQQVELDEGWSNFRAIYLGSGTWSVARGEWKWIFVERSQRVTSEHSSRRLQLRC